MAFFELLRHACPQIQACAWPRRSAAKPLTALHARTLHPPACAAQSRTFHEPAGLALALGALTGLQELRLSRYARRALSLHSPCHFPPLAAALRCPSLAPTPALLWLRRAPSPATAAPGLIPRRTAPLPRRCFITSDPRVLSPLSNLRVLALEEAALKEVALGAALEPMTRLACLDLRGCLLHQLPAAVAEKTSLRVRVYPRGSLGGLGAAGLGGCLMGLWGLWEAARPQLLTARAAQKFQPALRRPLLPSSRLPAQCLLVHGEHGTRLPPGPYLSSLQELSLSRGALFACHAQLAAASRLRRLYVCGSGAFWFDMLREGLLPAAAPVPAAAAAAGGPPAQAMQHWAQPLGALMAQLVAQSEAQVAVAPPSGWALENDIIDQPMTRVTRRAWPCQWACDTR